MREQPLIKEYQPAGLTPGGIWIELGLPSRGAKLVDLIHLGLPFEYLDRVASLIQVKRKVIVETICVSPATLSRRAKAGRLSTKESDRLVALIAAFEQALCLFENDASSAKKWMDAPVRGLGSKRPLDLLSMRVETEAVLDLIGRLERGVLM